MEPDDARSALDAFRRATECTPELRAANLRAIEARVHDEPAPQRNRGRIVVIAAVLAAAALAVWIARDLGGETMARRGDDPRDQALDADDGRTPAHVSTPAPASVPATLRAPASDTSRPSTPSSDPTPRAPNDPRPTSRDDSRSPAVAPSTEPPDALAREAALLASARRAIAAGELDVAARELATLAREFPHGTLVHERRLTELRLHCRTGDRAAAHDTAVALARTRPDDADLARLAADPCADASPKSP